MAKFQRVAVLTMAQALIEQIQHWDIDGGPGQPGPLFSVASLRATAASVVSEMAGHMHDQKLARSTRAVGQEVMQHALRGLAQDYDDGRFCGNVPLFPWPPKKFDPREDLFASVTPDAFDRVLASAARRLADVALREPTQTLSMAG